MSAGVLPEPTASLQRHYWPQVFVCAAAAAFAVAGVRSAQLLGAAVDWNAAAVGAAFFIVLTGLGDEWVPPRRKRAPAPGRVAAASLVWLTGFALVVWLLGAYDARLGTAAAAGLAASAAFSLADLAAMRVRHREPTELTGFGDASWERVEPHQLRWRDADVLLVISGERERRYANVRDALRLQVQLFEPQQTVFGGRPLGAGPLRALLTVEGPVRLTTSEFDERLFEHGVHVESASVRIDDARITIVLTDAVGQTLTIEAERAHSSGYILDAETVVGADRGGSSRLAAALRLAKGAFGGAALQPVAQEITPATTPDGLLVSESGWCTAGPQELPWQGSAVLFVTHGAPGPYLMVRRDERLQVQLFERRRRGWMGRQGASGTPIGLLAIDGPVVLTMRGDDAALLEHGLLVEDAQCSDADAGYSLVLVGPGNQTLTIEADPDDVRAFLPEQRAAAQLRPTGVPGS